VAATRRTSRSARCAPDTAASTSQSKPSAAEHSPGTPKPTGTPRRSSPTGSRAWSTSATSARRLDERRAGRRPHRRVPLPGHLRRRQTRRHHRRPLQPLDRRRRRRGSPPSTPARVRGERCRPPPPRARRRPSRLAALGYDTSWICLRASDIGAAHRRDRLFLLAARRDGPDGGAGGARDGKGPGHQYGLPDLIEGGTRPPGLLPTPTSGGGTGYMSGNRRDTVSILALILVAVPVSLGRLYCLIHAVRAAVRENDGERGERALKVIDKLTQRLSWRR
jgi:C-5 cytosine-specific DNA methylase